MLFSFLKNICICKKTEYVDLGEGRHLKMSLVLVSHLTPKSECSGMPAAEALLFLGYVVNICSCELRPGLGTG